jgi:hypothetical protein
MDLAWLLNNQVWTTGEALSCVVCLDGMDLAFWFRRNQGGTFASYISNHCQRSFFDHLYLQQPCLAYIDYTMMKWVRFLNLASYSENPSSAPAEQWPKNAVTNLTSKTKC